MFCWRIPSSGHGRFPRSYTFWRQEIKREKKTHEQAKAKLDKLEQRRGEISERQERAKAELGDAKQLFGRELIDGGDIEKLSAALSQKEAALTIISAGVEELDSRIGSQQRVVAEAEASLANAETRATMPRIVKDAVALIELLANAQVDIYRNIERSSRLQHLRQQHRVRGGLHNIKWEEAANKLAEAQAYIEADPLIASRSKVPTGGVISGFIDDEHRVPSLGSKVRDAARAEVSA